MNKFGLWADWTHIETEHSRNGRLPEPTDGNALAYIAQITECDARKTESLISEYATDPLILVRSLLFRGQLEEAKSILIHLLGDDTVDRAQFPKLLLEQARLAAFDAAWEACEMLADQALNSDPALITRLTLLQVRALGRFELGKFAAALADLNTVEALGVSFPKCITVFYAKLLKVRVIARTRGCSNIEFGLHQLWHALERDGNIDMLQSLLRVEIDLRRLARTPHVATAKTAWDLAGMMGEELYEELGLIDFHLAHCSNAFQPQHFQYARSKKMIDELQSGRPVSTSIRAALEYLEISPALALPVEQTSLPPLLYFGHVNKMVHLRPWKIVSLEKYPQLARVLQVLNEGPITKSDFFRKVWELKRYRSDLHDNLIYAVLHRLKKQTGAVALVRGGRIELENTRVIL